MAIRLVYVVADDPTIESGGGDGYTIHAGAGTAFTDSTNFTAVELDNENNTNYQEGDNFAVFEVTVAATNPDVIVASLPGTLSDFATTDGRINALQIVKIPTVQLAVDQIEIYGNTVGQVLATAPLAGTTELVLNGSNLDHKVTVNFAQGNPVPYGGITFHGNGQSTATGDDLVATGGSFNSITDNLIGPGEGNIDLPGATPTATPLPMRSESIGPRT